MVKSNKHSIVKAYWEGPLSVAEVLKRKKLKDKGIYQVYGDHLVFGPRSLLYVGMTVDQSFGVGFGQHYKHWLRYDTGVEIRLGYVRDPVALPLLEAVEALTIWWHSPPYNSRCIWRYTGKALHVQNWDERGRLHPEYSSHWGEPDLIPPEGEDIQPA